ncbi:MAG: anthranilate phosphoribosyltransferase [Myxococcales bacterium]|nr:anthranilate phosphoribosyltransferase [Myxococcales bacterium]
MILEAIRRVVEGQPLPAAVMEGAMNSVLAGEATPAQIAGLAIALRMRGETVDEIAAAVRVMRRHADLAHLDVAGPILDTAGTGGDGLRTFNISTVAAIIIASCGVKVAKHGNRAVSSSCGSADVIEALGVPLDSSPAEVAASVRELGIGFLFAPSHHRALRHAAPVRRDLALRTIFNLLGPLANPAGVTHQVLGVYDPARIEQLAHVLKVLGLEGAWVVHGHGGLDEVSPAGPTHVAWLRDGEVETLVVEPLDFGVEPFPIESLVGGDAARNAEIIESLLDGSLQGGPRAAVILNAAAGLCVTGLAKSPREGAERAEAAIDRGDARRLLAAWRAWRPPVSGATTLGQSASPAAEEPPAR